MGGGAEDTKILYSSIPDEVNPAKLPYIGAMMAQGERHPMCQDPAWEQLSVAPLTRHARASELQSERKDCLETKQLPLPHCACCYKKENRT